MEATALVTLSLILFLSFTKNGVSASRDISITVDHHPDPTPVVDKDENEVKSDQYYYFEPYAIVPGIVNHGTTRQFVFETKVFKGLPVKFSSVRQPESDTIYESEDVYISYNDQLSSEIVGGSPRWRVGLLLPRPVTLGGGNDRRSQFRIVKAGSDRYKLRTVRFAGDIGIRNTTNPDAAFLDRKTGADKTFEFTLVREGSKASA